MAGMAPQARFCSDACRKRDELARKDRDSLALDTWRGRDEERLGRALAMGISDPWVAEVFKEEITAHSASGRSHITAVVT
jgi:hypothetical protein